MVVLLKRPLYVTCDWSITGWTRAANDLFLLFALVAVLIFLPASISFPAELARPTEYELKAAFLYNFIKFTQWPPDELGKSSDTFVIGVLGKDPFGPALDKVIEGETIHNKRIVVRRFAKAEEAAGSQVLFISSLEEINVAAILKLIDRQSVLTISERENFAQRGGIINFKNENNRIVFEINLDAAKRAGLTMNAQLLKLARIVNR